MTERIDCRKRNAKLMERRCTNPAYRILEQNADTNRRRLTRTNPAYRILEQNADTNQRRLTRQTNPPEIGHKKMKGMLHLWQQDVLIYHTERRKMRGMLKLWQQVVLIQHTEDRSKLLILIIEDHEDKLILQ
jgi:hypothetical protein